MLDIPKFKSSPKVGQFIFYRIVLSILVILLLYLTVFVNYWILQITVPSFINWVFIIVFILSGLIVYVHSQIRFNNFHYLFFDDHMEIYDKRILKVDYLTMKNISYKQNLIDKKFNTGTIIISMNSGKSLSLKHLIDSNQVFFFMQKKMSIHPASS
jgi:membrane protein YdbS with pleckstrin-like domain